MKRAVNPAGLAIDGDGLALTPVIGIAMLKDRIDGLNGFKRGTKRDNSPEAREEVQFLNTIWETAGQLNMELMRWYYGKPGAIPTDYSAFLKSVNEGEE